ncbi:uncharacterized protein [Eurosta solidaginis]|uniref:uncharacterized protein isoform X2 n=1 Tax=Eurosta solidaginis TaxID=178769 RepID=UPI0035317537
MDGIHDTNFNVRLVKTIKKFPILYNPEHKDYTNREARETAWIEIGDELSCDPRILQRKWQNFRTVFLRKLKRRDAGDYENNEYYLYKYLKFLIPHLKNPYWKDYMNKSPKKYLNKEHKNDEDGQNKYETFSNHSLEDDNAIQETDDNNDYYEEDIDAMLMDTKPKIQWSESSDKDEFVAEDDVNFERELNEMSRDYDFGNRPTTPTIDYASSSTVNSYKRKLLQTVEECDPKRQFLMSLLPDLNEMTKSQLRHFKSNVLLIVEDILEQERSC